VKKKKRPAPKWWKNTYFWIGFILIGLALWGFASGEQVIRDPGQREESGLVWIYLAAAIIMIANGIMSHRSTVFEYNEAEESEAAQADGEGEDRPSQAQS